MTKRLRERVPQNAEGDFYVERDHCLRCCLPHVEAPELLNDTSVEFQECYFKLQPTNDEEFEHAIKAACVSCIENLRYGGTDPAIIERFVSLGYGRLCDHSDAQNGSEPK